MTAVIEVGATVQFRPSFSLALVGMTFEVLDLHPIERGAEAGRTIVSLRIRRGQTKPRWYYRTAWLSDLLPVQADQ